MLLSIDTSSSECVVTLGDASTYWSRCDGLRHSRVLLPMINDLLHEANIPLIGLSGISVGVGPGSFVGVRLGVSVVQGLAFGLNLPVWPLSSLRILAQSLFLQSAQTPVFIHKDAQMGEWYLGEYAFDESSQTMKPLSEEKMLPASEFNTPLNETKTPILPEALHQIGQEAFTHSPGISVANLSPNYLKSHLWKTL